MSKYWKHPNILIKQLAPNHKAVVSNAPIPSNQILFEYKAELSKLPTRFTLQLNENWHIDSNEEHEWRYLNHSCDPNVRITNVQIFEREPRNEARSSRGIAQ